MARQPTPGGDTGSWGTILNEYLDVAHNSDGTHKPIDQGFATIADLLADTATDYTEGQVLVAEGFRYEVAAAAAIDHQLATAGGIKLYIREWEINAEGVGASTEGSQKSVTKIKVTLRSGSSFNASDAAANKSIMDDAIAALPEGGCLEVLRSTDSISLYSLAAINKMITLDLGGNEYLWDSSYGDESSYTSSGSGSIRPLIRFYGTTDSYSLSASISKGDFSITVTSAAANALSNGAIFYLRSSDTVPFWNVAGSYAIGELNTVRAISGTTIDLGDPARFDYSSSITLEILSSRGARIKNAVIRETDRTDRYGGSVGGSNTPNVIRMEDIINYEIDNITFYNVNISAVSTSGCYGSVVKQCRSYVAQRPSEGGHGNLVKLQDRFNEKVMVLRCESLRIRHHVDFTNAHNCRSIYNYGVENTGTYSWHGFGTDRCWSIHDESQWSTNEGWGVGRTKFGNDTNIRIIDPSGSTRTTRMFQIYGDSDQVSIEGGYAYINRAGSVADLILIAEAARNVTIDGIEVHISSTTIDNLCYIRQYIEFGGGSNESFSEVPTNITIRNCTFHLENAMEAIQVDELAGYLDVEGNRYVIQDTTTCTGVKLENSVDAGLVFNSIGNRAIQRDTGRLTIYDSALTLAGVRDDFVEDTAVNGSTVLAGAPARLSNIPVLYSAEFTELVPQSTNSATVLAARADDSCYDITVSAGNSGQVAVFRVWFGQDATQVLELANTGTIIECMDDGSGNIVLAHTQAFSYRLNAFIERKR